MVQVADSFVSNTLLSPLRSAGSMSQECTVKSIIQTRSSYSQFYELRSTANRDAVLTSGQILSNIQAIVGFENWKISLAVQTRYLMLLFSKPKFTDI